MKYPMTKNLKTTSPAKTLAKLKKLFGPPPVLSSEDRKAYDTIMARFMECLEPRDFIEQMFVKDLTNSTWDVRRYSRHMSLVIEREHQRHQDMEEKRRQKERKLKSAIAEQLDAAKEASRAKETEHVGETGRAEQADHAGAPTTQFERKLELEWVIDSSIPDVDEIVLAPAEECDHAKALQSGIDYFEQLDHLRSVAIARRNDVLRQIDFYRQGLGQHLRRVSDEIIDAVFSETRSTRRRPLPALMWVCNDVSKKGGGQPDERPQKLRAAHHRRQGTREPQCTPAWARRIQQQG